MNRMYENKPRDTYNKRMSISVSTAVAISRSISRSISISLSICIHLHTILLYLSLSAQVQECLGPPFTTVWARGGLNLQGGALSCEGFTSARNLRSDRSLPLPRDCPQYIPKGKPTPASKLAFVIYIYIYIYASGRGFDAAILRLNACICEN